MTNDAIEPQVKRESLKLRLPGSTSPIPVVLPGRLAVDLQYQGRGLSRALLQDAL